MSRILVVNADDYGLTPGVCEAVLRAAERGIVTSTSALVVAPAWERHAPALAASGLGVGAHLCVVGEDPPLLSAREVPTLVDAAGRFPLSWRQFLRRSALGRVDTDDLRRELGAQVERARSAGVRLTHLDSHQNLHLWPQLAGVLFELADRHGIAAARRTRSVRRDPASVGVRLLSARFATACARHGLAVPEASAGLDEAGHLTTPELAAAVDVLAATGARTAELATHPGTADDPDRVRYAWGYRWPEELAALCDPAIRDRIAAAGFVLGDFGDVAAAAAGGTRAPA